MFPKMKNYSQSHKTRRDQLAYLASPAQPCSDLWGDYQTISVILEPELTLVPKQFGGFACRNVLMRMPNLNLFFFLRTNLETIYLPAVSLAASPAVSSATAVTPRGHLIPLGAFTIFKKQIRCIWFATCHVSFLWCSHCERTLLTHYTSLLHNGDGKRHASMQRLWYHIKAAEVTRWNCLSGWEGSGTVSHSLVQWYLLVFFHLWT